MFLSLRHCLVLGVVTCSVGHAQEAKKQAIPGNKEVVQAAALIGELFKDELTRLRKEPGLKAALALRFLEEARETRDFPAGRYALLLDARDMATEAGDGPTALAAIEELHQTFALPPGDVLAMKIRSLREASKGNTSPAGYQTLVDLSLVLLEDAIAADDYPSALDLVAAAEGAARKLRNVPLVTAIRKRAEEVARAEKEFARWRPFAEQLAKNPGDPKANLEMGRYHALVKGDWEKGLPLLALGSDRGLSGLVKKDLAEPRKGADQADLGEAWLAAAEAMDGGMRYNALLRGYHWLQQALGDVDAARRPAVQKQLDAVVKKLPPEFQMGEINGEIRKCEGSRGPVFGVAFSPDGKKVVAASGDGAILVFDARTGKEQRRLDGHNGRVWSVAFGADNRRILSGGLDSSVRLWDLLSGRETRRLPGHADYVRCVAVSRDGHRALSGGDDRLLRLWNLDTNTEIRSFPGHDHFVWSVALSRDGKRALSASLDKTVRLWDVESGSMVKKLEGHGDTVLSVAFTPDGRRAVSGSTDKTLRLWDLETGETLATLAGHKGYVHSVAVSPDGRRALSAGQDRTVRLWDLVTGKEIRTLEGHGDQVWAVAFSSDGRFAASAGHDGTVRIWGNVK